jgi:hypothetical protein
MIASDAACSIMAIMACIGCERPISISQLVSLLSLLGTLVGCETPRLSLWLAHGARCLVLGVPIKVIGFFEGSKEE